ncbi:hypothetical protein [Stenotrophomonas maltophilia]|uniref:hypothetical protein n=1 Tax=Stenotrophomonas maltophilia TaxID=40324 RepID=UPI000B4E6E95|nr:hypothetical protein [Stenotrophomonas maltophilia]OWQ58490.1 hypothetical protein CEE59_08500 [Stenotrophomonas maltophilia]PZS84518.1 hypothetical protein A7X74_06105 [Stenotrophomonas maltophilia]
MIDQEQLRSYHRQQVLYALQQASEPMTASEVHEGMTTLALAMGHPRECAAITPAAVAGILRGMLGEQLVIQGEDKANRRYGRAEPTWSAAAGHAQVSQPTAPGRIAAAPVGAPMAAGQGTQLRQITMDQRLAFLQAECAALLADVTKEHAAFELRVRSQMEAFEARAARLLGLPQDGGQ